MARSIIYLYRLDHPKTTRLLMMHCLKSILLYYLFRLNMIIHTAKVAITVED
jgi:hypothetical protein